MTNLSDKRLDIVSSGDAFEYAVASSAVPGLFRARRVDGRLFCDGGTVDVSPFEHWLDDPDVETKSTSSVTVFRGSEDFSAERENLFGISVDMLSEFGEDESPPAGTEETFAKCFLERFDLSANGGLRDAERLCRPPQIALLRHRPKVAEMMVVEKFVAAQRFVFLEGFDRKLVIFK